VEGSGYRGRATIRYANDASGGPLTVMNMWSTGKKEQPSAFSQSTYRLGRDGFSLTGTKTTRGSNAAIAALANRAGFNQSSFRGCTV
jgi:hypothetical protein